jgi:hypothetical protein
MNSPINYAQAEPMGKAFHDAQGIVPQCLDLDGLAVPRRDHPIADFDIYPGQLHARFAGGEQPVAAHSRPQSLNQWQPAITVCCAPQAMMD